MASPRDAFVDHCLELLAPLGAPRARRMFGGHGIYLDDLFVAIVAFDRLYLKVDDLTRAAVEAAGGQPFAYEARGRTVASRGYFSAPDDAMDSPDAMHPWARQALAAAVRARAARPASASRRPAAKRPAKAASPRKAPAAARAATPSRRKA